MNTSSEYPREFTMASAPKNGTVIRAILSNGTIKSVYWVRNSQFGRDGGAYYDGQHYFKPIEFLGWKP